MAQLLSTYETIIPSVARATLRNIAALHALLWYSYNDPHLPQTIDVSHFSHIIAAITLTALM